MKKSLSIAAAAGFVAFGASAQVVPGAFAPEATETYESTPGNYVFLPSIFGGDVAVIPSVDEHCTIFMGQWLDFRTGATIMPASGNTFGAIYGFDGFTLDFTGVGGIHGFSGWGTDAATDGETRFQFYNMGGDLIGDYSGKLGTGDGLMEWFSFVSPVAIGSIRLSGPETAFDDLSYTTAIPAPSAAALLAGAGLFASRRRRA